MELELCDSKVDWKPDFNEKSKKTEKCILLEILLEIQLLNQFFLWDNLRDIIFWREIA